MIRILFCFPKSDNVEEIDEYITNTFIPRAKQIKGMQSIKMSGGDLMSPGGPPPYSRVVEGTLNSFEEMMAFVQDPATEEEREYTKKLGVFVLYYEVKDA